MWEFVKVLVGLCGRFVWVQEYKSVLHLQTPTCYKTSRTFPKLLGNTRQPLPPPQKKKKKLAHISGVSEFAYKMLNDKISDLSLI